MPADRRPEVEVAAAGLVCSLGRTAEQTALLVRAGHMELQPTPFGSWDRPLRMCLLSELAADVVGFERLELLARPALAQIVASPRGPVVRRDREIPLLLALPPSGRADDDPARADDFAARLATGAELRLDRARSATVRGGSATGVRLLGRALDLFAEREVDQVVVGGVDGYYHPALLAALDDEERLFGRDEPHGFVPGEAAAFLLLERRRSASSAPAAPPDAVLPAGPRLCWAEVAAIPDEVWLARAGAPEPDERAEPEPAGGARHPDGHPATARRRAAAAVRTARTRVGLAWRRFAHRHGGAWWPGRRRSPWGSEPRRAEAADEDRLPDPSATMSALCERARGAFADRRLDWVLTDLSHDRERTDEWASVMVRSLPPGAIYAHALHQLGDLGAASALTLVAIAWAHWQLGSAPAEAALVTAHSHDAERGVVLLGRSA